MIPLSISRVITRITSSEKEPNVSYREIEYLKFKKTKEKEKGKSDSKKCKEGMKGGK